MNQSQNSVYNVEERITELEDAYKEVIHNKNRSLSGNYENKIVNMVNINVTGNTKEEKMERQYLKR